MKTAQEESAAAGLHWRPLFHFQACEKLLSISLEQQPGLALPQAVRLLRLKASFDRPSFPASHTLDHGQPSGPQQATMEPLGQDLPPLPGGPPVATATAATEGQVPVGATAAGLLILPGFVTWDGTELLPVRTPPQEAACSLRCLLQLGACSRLMHGSQGCCSHLGASCPSHPCLQHHDASSGRWVASYRDRRQHLVPVMSALEHGQLMAAVEAAEKVAAMASAPASNGHAMQPAAAGASRLQGLQLPPHMQRAYEPQSPADAAQVPTQLPAAPKLAAPLAARTAAAAMAQASTASVLHPKTSSARPAAPTQRCGGIVQGLLRQLAGSARSSDGGEDGQPFPPRHGHLVAGQEARKPQRCLQFGNALLSPEPKRPAVLCCLAWVYGTHGCTGGGHVCPFAHPVTANCTELPLTAAGRPAARAA